MTLVLAWTLSVVGPTVLVVLPQWLARRALGRRGLPLSLEAARLVLLGWIAESCITVAYRVDGERRVPLKDVIGDTLSDETRIANRKLLQAYTWYYYDWLMLPLVYRWQPAVVLGIMHCLVNLLVGSDALIQLSPDGSPGLSTLQKVWVAGTAFVGFVWCAAFSKIIAAYLRITEVIDRLQR